MLDICKDIDQYCPDAIFLNYTNPMAMLCRIMQAVSQPEDHRPVPQRAGHRRMLAKWIGADMADVTYTCAGINHQAFYLEYKVKGQDAYPLIRKAITEAARGLQRGDRAQRDVPQPGLLCDRVLRPQQRVQPLVPQAAGPDRYLLSARTGWNPGEYAYILNEYRSREGATGSRRWTTGWPRMRST